MRREDERARYCIRTQDRSALLCEGDLVIGRSPYCSLILEHETLSRVHATLRAVDGGLLLIDENSSNGTFVNGARIAHPTRVGPGDAIRLGRVEIVIELDHERSSRDTGRLPALRPTDHGPEHVTAATRRDDEHGP